MREVTPIDGRGGDKPPAGSPIQALNEFYDAFNSRDLQEMANNWLTTDEVVTSTPEGIARGWNAVSAVYKHLFDGPAKIHIELNNYIIHETGDVFYMVGQERGEITKGGGAIQLAIRIARIFAKIEGRWRQVCYHGSFDNPNLVAEIRKAMA